MMKKEWALTAIRIVTRLAILASVWVTAPGTVTIAVGVLLLDSEYTQLTMTKQDELNKLQVRLNHSLTKGLRHNLDATKDLQKVVEVQGRHKINRLN